MPIAVSLASIATCAVSAWMCVMYLVLRHPGYELRAAMAGIICLGAATLVAGRPPSPLRIPIAVWAAALAVSGILALVAPGDDGWVLVAGTLFVLEGGLGLASTLIRR